MLRRHFLQGLVVTVLAACGDDEDSPSPAPFTPSPTSTPEQSHAAFPQGVASGDPRPDGVILWTRAEPTALGGAATITLDYLVATDEALTQVVASGQVVATADADHSVRLRLEQLTPATRYFYRFAAGTVTTQVGRTRTAPARDTDAPVSFAFAACQDYVGRYYHGWQALLDEKPDLDFVLFLGDYIYETAGDPRFQSPTPGREIKLPEGLALGGPETNRAALSLADYRYLYRTYRSDAALREVHRLYPFIILWDDHEFANDCWQDHATDFDGEQGDEQSTARRRAATQAWAEFQPVDVTRDASRGFSDEVKVYRTLRYGKHLELFLTDQRLYRSDHVIPEGPADTSVAKFSKNSSLGSRNFVLKQGFDLKEAATPPTMLGTTQRDWLVLLMKSSTATWKVWGNEVQLWQMALDLSSFDALPEEYRGRFYFSCDQWDGYRTERSEVLSALSGVENLVACTGDIHAFYAAELHPDFDQPGATPVGVEYVTAGISSQSLEEITRLAIKGSPVLDSLGLGELVPQLDSILLQTNSAHLRHAQSAANGLALATVSAAAFEVTFLRTGDPLNAADGGVKTRTRFRTDAGSRRVTPVLFYTPPRFPLLTPLYGYPGGAERGARRGRSCGR